MRRGYPDRAGLAAHADTYRRVAILLWVLALELMVVELLRVWP